MKIPRDPQERQDFYSDLVRQCLASRQERFEFYRACRNYYLFGTLDDSGVPFNKIKSALKTYVSFLYAPDSVRFVLSVGTTAGRDDIARAMPLQNEITQQWKMSHTHLLFKKAVLWSLVFGVMLVKVDWDKKRNTNVTYIVEPHQFGVLREDVPALDDQEAFCLCYTTTRTELANRLQGDPRRESLLQRLGTHIGDSSPGFGDGMTRLLLTNPVGGVPGSVSQQFGPVGGAGGTTDGGLTGGAVSYNYAPKVATELIDMRELYVWNDDTEDYQIVTMGAPSVMIYDRPQARMGLAGMPNFAKVVADDDLYDYFWASSYVADLAGLQQWRSEDISNIRNLQSKQSDPPVSATSVGGIMDEKLAALRQKGGRLAITDPNAKIQVHAPAMPEAPFQTINEIDNMFNDASGISHVMQGRGESGVRSKGQADVLARLGSARVKSTAVQVEECAEDVATLMFRAMQENSTQRFQTGETEAEPGLQFTAEQFTKDFELKVDAHSSSPIFVEDHRQNADDMLERRIIDREEWIDMVNPPNAQRLKVKLKKIEAQEEKAAQMKMQAEAAKHGGGRPAE